MKRIINGKTYNTETALEIASFESSLSQSDFRYKEETLYLTKKGQYFLAGEGHAMTKWCTNNGNSSSWGEGIELLDELEARTWCEHNSIDTSIIEQHFEIIEG